MTYVVINRYSPINKGCYAQMTIKGSRITLGFIPVETAKKFCLKGRVRRYSGLMDTVTVEF